jgi:hypothetical protein
MNRSDEWNAAQAGKAKDAFNRATTQQAKTTAQAQGEGSGMIKESKPTPVPPPPAIGQAVNQQLFKQRMAKENAAAKSVQPQVSGNLRKPVIELKHLKEGARLHQQFQKAARKEQDRGR